MDFRQSASLEKCGWRSLFILLPEILETRQSQDSSAVGQRSRHAAETREAALTIQECFSVCLQDIDAQPYGQAVTAITAHYSLMGSALPFGYGKVSQSF